MSGGRMTDARDELLAAVRDLTLARLPTCTRCQTRYATATSKHLCKTGRTWDFTCDECIGEKDTHIERLPHADALTKVLSIEWQPQEVGR